MVLAVAGALLATVVVFLSRSALNLKKQILSLLPASNRLIQKVVLY